MVSLFHTRKLDVIPEAGMATAMRLQERGNEAANATAKIACSECDASTLDKTVQKTPTAQHTKGQRMFKPIHTAARRPSGGVDDS
jgi:hypothetical protein